MTCDSLPRLALASLAPVLALAVSPALAQDAAPVPGNRYLVVNQTSAPLTCRYRVNSIATGGGGGQWQDASPVAAGGAFTRTVQDPGESLSFDCNAGDARARSVALQPGLRYSATQNSDGKVVVARVRDCAGAGREARGCQPVAPRNLTSIKLN
jgi:hypothetical protein